MSRAERRPLIEREDPALPIFQQCRLLAVSRSSVYRPPAVVSEEECAIMALIERQYLARPYYGSRRMAAWLATQGHLVNRKRVRRLMQLMGPVAVYSRPNASKPAPENKVYPYLLGGLSIARVNQVWCADITYIPMAKGCQSAPKRDPRSASNRNPHQRLRSGRPRSPWRGPARDAPCLHERRSGARGEALWAPGVDPRGSERRVRRGF